jgi:hypothetical protein
VSVSGVFSVFVHSTSTGATSGVPKAHFTLVAVPVIFTVNVTVEADVDVGGAETRVSETGSVMAQWNVVLEPQPLTLCASTRKE